MTTPDTAKHRTAEIAYDAIAPVYDDFTAHHDFELWFSNVLPELEKHGLVGNRLLDVGCGTGKSFLSMLDRGWSVTGCDVSAAMLEQAARKAGGQAELLIADMRKLPVLGSFDLVWCLDDAINYLLSQEELRDAFLGFGRNLRDTGLLLFDVNTIEVFRTFFADEVVVEKGDRKLIWRGLSSPDFPSGAIAEAEFLALPVEGSEDPIVPPSIHRERHFPEELILEALGGAGLECVGVYGHHDDAVLHQPLHERRHTKAVYIARPAR